MRDTIDMAREAGAIVEVGMAPVFNTHAELKAFEALVRADEREQALAAPVQEPVARVVLTETLELPCLQWLDLNRQFDFKGGEYLYTNPPQRTWVGLTDEDCKNMSEGDSAFVMWVEAKLKQKNGYAEEKNNG
jgi:hypothetical protein